MPIDKDMYMIFETYAKPATPNKVNHNHPSTLADVKKSTAATSATGLDTKGQGSDIGLAGNTPVDVSEEDAETVKGTADLTGVSTDELLKELQKRTNPAK